ncbi:MAG TPA: EAL domain-containing protein [Rudaea sp.]
MWIERAAVAGPAARVRVSMGVDRRFVVVTGATFAALLGVVLLCAAVLLVLRRTSVAAEEEYAGGLAESLGRSTEQIILDTRDMLAGFDALSAERCSPEHLRKLQEAALSRPYIRAIGYWQAIERKCGVGFLPEGLKPAHADRIYDSGVIAWWPGPQTMVGGVPLFLMRYGNHDVAIDPRQLLNLGPAQDRKAVLWVEKLRMAALPWDVSLPEPDSLPVGITVDRDNARVLSRFSRSSILPIDVVAMEPIGNFWSRHALILAFGAGAALLLVVAWVYVVQRISREQLSMATELRHAIAAGRIDVQYQPVIDLKSGRCVGAEALARWHRSNGERVNPDHFIALAEQHGLIQDITLSVLRRAVRDFGAVRAEFPDLCVNVNLSADDLKNERIAAELSKLLATSQLAPETIKLEITERALVNSDTARALIRQFRSRGHQIAVDDFGTGYSSLSYLQSFELDVLKIDRSFVSAIGTEAATSQVIVHVIAMSQSLGLTAIAEGIETPAQAGWLVKHGVTSGQGFLFSKPLALEDFIGYLRTNRRAAAA